MWPLIFALMGCPTPDTTDSDTEVGTDPGTDVDSGTDVDPGSDSDADSDSDVDSDTDVDSDSDTTVERPITERESHRRWRLVFEDDFNGPDSPGDPCYDAAVTPPVCMDRYWSTAGCAAAMHSQIADLNKCTWALYDIYNWMDWGLSAEGRGMNALDPNQVSVVDGELRLSAERASGSGPWQCGTDIGDYYVSKNCPIRSGAVLSNPRYAPVGFDQAYGRFEVRAIIPNQLGAWPAHWMLPTEGPWPDAGEIDIMEAVAHNPTDVHGSFHGGMWDGDVHVHHARGHHHDPGDPRFANEWHTYTVEWSPDRLRFYVDDMMTGELTEGTMLVGDVLSAPDAGLVGSEWDAFPVDIPDDPFFFILNTSVVQTGGWNMADFAPLQHRIDWVRAYEACPPDDVECEIRGTGTSRVTDRFWMSGPKWSGSYRTGAVGDFDGDGRADLLLRTAFGGHATYWLPGDAVDGLSHERTVTDVGGMSAGAWADDANRSVIGDFDGDGADDVLLIARSGDAARVVLGGSGGPASVVNLSSRTDWSGRVPVVGDFNGDERSDVILLPSGPFDDATRLLGGGTVLLDGADITSEGGMSANRYSTALRIPHVADLNGDGRDDLLLQPRTADSFPVVLLSTETGFSRYEDWTGEGGLLDPDWAADTHTLHLFDRDADGDADVLLQGTGLTGHTYLAENVGGALATRRDLTHQLGMNGGDWSRADRALHVAELNGDDRPDLLLVGRDATEPTLVLMSTATDWSPALDWTRHRGMGGPLWSLEDHELLVSDLDGDGLSDLFLRGLSPSDDSFLIFGGEARDARR